MLNGSTYRVLPRIAPLNSSLSVRLIVKGLTQIVGRSPAASRELEQMNVLSSTRATSVGSLRA